MARLAGIAGGVTSQVFLYPVGVNWIEVQNKLEIDGTPNANVIRNAKAGSTVGSRDLDISLLEGGFIKGEKLMAVASAYVGGLDIQSLPLSYAAVATDLQTGREIWLRKGDLLNSIRASIALPGIFDVMASSLNIMQDRITRSRMAGEPPDVLLSPRLSRLGLMEFDQAEVAIDEGRACVERMRPALDQILSGL